MTFVLVHDTLLDNPVLRGKGKRRIPYTPAEAFIWLIGRAARRPYTRDGVALARGELTFSFRYLAEAWGWTPSKVQRYLDKLEHNRMVATRSDTGQLVITLCKYSEYQDPKRGTDTRFNTVAKVEPIHSRYKGEQKSNRDNVDETGNVGERGGPGGGRKASPPAPSDHRRGFGSEDALPGQEVLPGFDDADQELADQELEPVAATAPAEVELAAVPPEPPAPDLGSPAIAVEVLAAPAPVTAPPPEVGSPAAATNVVAITVKRGKKPATPKTRWPEGAIVPDDWIAEGEALAARLGLHDLDVRELAETFVDHYRKTGGLMADWRSAWRSFVRMEKKFNRRPGNGNGNGSYNGHAGNARPVTGQAATVELRRLLAEKRGRG